MTGMMAQTGSLGQPLLIPLSVPGPIAGQGGVALLTLPTTSLASLSGFAATNVAGNLLKLPFAGLQGKKKTNKKKQSGSGVLQVFPSLIANKLLFIL